MSHGYWGSRLPLGNLICSKFIFTAIRCRLAGRRFRNLLKSSTRSKAVQLVNDASTAEAFKRWQAQGYDKLNIGGGQKNLEGFINVDFVSYPNVERPIVANILDLSFIPDGCASHVHTNHVVEHLTEEQLMSQLREYHRILKDTGLLTIRCPNTLGSAYGFWFEPTLGYDTKSTFINPSKFF